MYKVAYEIEVGGSNKNAEKTVKPEGPITLITVHSKKKAVPVIKSKPTDVSSVKEISKKDFEN